MKRSPYLLLCFAIAGCVADDTFTPGGGGGGGGGGGSGTGTGTGGGTGGGTSTGSTDAVYSGVLCSLTNLAGPRSCDTPSEINMFDFDEVNLLHAENNKEVEVNANGSFNVPVGDLQGPDTLILSGPPFRGTVYRVTPNVTAIPNAVIITQRRWEDFININAISEVSGSGAIVVYVRRNGVALAGAQITANGASAGLSVYYADSSGSQVWDPNGLATSSVGAAAIINNPAIGNQATTRLDFSGPGGDVTLQIDDVPVVEDSTTFIFVDLDLPEDN